MRELVLKKRKGEIFRDTKVRLSKRTGIKGKAFEKIKFALVQKIPYAKPSYLEDGKSQIIHQANSLFLARQKLIPLPDDILYEIAQQDDLLGLDHVNRSKALAGKGDSIFIR